ncbi:hypothetical protein GCM10009801_02260 [Streptomyces albiaxialis]|uniref:Cupin type-2 domain-containing protein n=1 Tax=Streptomyces albiaxialis TaxID=329523 RepID=A0ABN2VEM3_9ACTN
MTTRSPSPVEALDLFGSLLQLQEGGAVDVTARPGPRDPGLWTVGAFHADSDRAVHADVWERHPEADEVLCLLSGRMRVYLRDSERPEEPVAVLTPGTCLVVPAGHWHRLSVEEPGDLLTISPRAGSEHTRATLAPARGEEPGRGDLSRAEVE